MGTITTVGTGSGTVRVLLVGIDDYSAVDGYRSLRGCRNDIAAARDWLTRRFGSRALVRRLLDEEATVEAVSAGFTEHLARADAGDTALFWYSGHGTDFPDADGAHAFTEPTGRYQALALADGPLLDKELGALLDTVAALGVPTTAVLDCCFSGGGTRANGAADLDDDGGAGAADARTARFLPTPRAWRPRPGSRDAATDYSGPPRHALLAACRLNESAYERRSGGLVHGVFTQAVLTALDDAPADGRLTHRDLLAAAGARVTAQEAGQHPVLAPLKAGSAADAPFPGGTPGPVGQHLLRYGGGGWEVDCGAAHGLRADADGTEFTVPEGTAAGPGTEAMTGTVRVRAVRADHSLVTPYGWTPDERRVYPVELSALALPPVGVDLDDTGHPEAGRRLREALACAGPGGGPSPLLTPAAAASGVRLRAVVTATGVRIRPPDDTPGVAELPLRTAPDARRAADCLIHLARWYQARDLSHPMSSLSGQVRIEITPWGGARPLTPGADGELTVPYEDSPDGLHEPWVSIALHNTSRRPLWCALVDLTDSYASHTVLFPGDFVGPGLRGHALDGEPVRLALPESRPVRPGAQVLDWLKLLVADTELNTLPFQFPAWRPGGTAADRQSAAGLDGTWRLAPAGHRDAGPATTTARWGTRTVRLRTRVPGAPDAPDHPAG
ncbi:caspase family protein [Streptomyces sp. NPDC005486]|uniref:caspase family protein n=1 Tax=Streptomyces sp. NPDC005486 TaxID=3155345 RepID=UPI0033A73064